MTMGKGQWLEGGKRGALEVPTMSCFFFKNFLTFKFNFIGVKLIYNVLGSGVQQRKSVIHKVYSFFFPVEIITNYWVDFPVLYSGFLLILFLDIGVVTTLLPTHYPFALHLLAYPWIFSFFFSFLLFRAASAAYGSSQARGPIGPVAAGLCHSHSNATPDQSHS